jgi:membrane protein YdbS with pleckstrin-like domain
MYNVFRRFCERLLRIPEAPEPPPGDEAQTQLFRAAPNYYRYLLVLWALKTAGTFLFLLALLAGPLIALFTSHSRDSHGWAALLFGLEGLALLIGLVSALFALAMVRLDFEKRWYVVTDRSLRVREGIRLVREATVTFANIQNISISQGPLQRALGIADLRVDTAGGGGGNATRGTQPRHNLHTTWFRGVNNANAIRELMQQRLRQLKDSGLGDHEELLSPKRPTTSSPAMVSALRELRAEATALREAVRRK